MITMDEKQFLFCTCHLISVDEYIRRYVKGAGKREKRKPLELPGSVDDRVIRIFVPFPGIPSLEIL